MTDQRWCGLLRQAYPAGGYERRLEELEITKVRIFPETHVWEISFLTDFPFSDEEQGQICRTLYNSFGQDIRLEVKAEEKVETPQASEILKSALEETRGLEHSGLLHESAAGIDREEELLNQRLAEKQRASGNKKKGPAVIIGRKITNQPVLLQYITDESRNVVLEAKAFRLNEQKVLPAGTELYDFDVTDYTGSIKVKVFADPKKKGKTKKDWLQKDCWYRMKGSVRYDVKTKELVFFPDDVAETERVQRQDNAPQKRVELHCHTKLSAMDAVASPEELVRQAIDWGHEAIAITDHGVVQAFPEALKAAKEDRRNQPIKVIYGLEGYMVEGDGSGYMAEQSKKGKRRSVRSQQDAGEGAVSEGEANPGRWHIILLARNQTGIRNLYELVTLSHLNYFYKKPLIPRELLSRFREGLLVGAACEAGEVFQQALADGSDSALEKVAAFYDYLEIQPLMNNAYLLRNGRVADEEGLMELNRRIVSVGRKMGKPVAATCDVHFCQPEDEVLRRILQAGQNYKDADLQPPLYLRTTEEMLEEFSYLGEDEAYQVVVEATRSIADQVECVKPIPEKLSTPKLPGAKEEVLRMVRQKAEELYGDAIPEWIAQRLELEIRSITEYGYADLYFIAHKLVKFSNDHGYMVGSRGSVGSSLVAYLADITEVNPLAPHYRCPGLSCKHVIQGDTDLYGCGADMPDLLCPACGVAMRKEGFHIPFEVFLGFEGNKTPDIDLNFSSGEHQTQAQKYTEELFGKENTFKAGTITTIAEKTAFGFVKNYYKDRNIEVRDIETERLVGGLTGVRRTTGQHPGGVIILPKGDDILNYTPVQRPADASDSEFITTHFDYHAIDGCLVKLDILGHDDPAMIRSLVGMTGKEIGEISLDDPEVMALFRGPEVLGLNPEKSGIETGTLGVPEFGTSFVRGMLLDTKPSTFADLIRISGFSHGEDVWLNNNRDIIREKIGTMKEVIGCRDDVMLTLIRYGVNPSHAFRIMEQVRKGNGLKREDTEAMEEAQVPGWYFVSCQKVKYLFPKAHAVAYVMMAFRIAWFKVNEPLAFYAATFSVREGLDGAVAAGGLPSVEAAMAEIRAKRERREATGTDEDRYVSLELAREMLLRGYEFAPIDLEKSDADMYKPEEGKLRLPFTSLNGFGLPTSRNIVAGREEKPYRSIEDLRKRGKIGGSLVAILKEHGALGSLPESDQQTLFYDALCI